MKFEVGKKYKGRLGNIFTCLYVTPKGHGVLVDDQTGTNEFLVYDHSVFKEYHEPVKRWFNKYRIKSTGDVFLAANDDARYGYLDKIQAELRHSLDNKYEYLGTVEIEF